MIMDRAQDDLLKKAEAYVEKFYAERIPSEYVYHNFGHTCDVVESVQLIGAGYELSKEEFEVLQLAAWFHDTGYDKGPDQHEQRACEHVEAFLQGRAYPQGKLQKVFDCILATAIDFKPSNLLEMIIRDADVSHLGSKLYWDRCSRVREELGITRNMLMSEKEWIEFELDFITNHEFHTEVANELYNSRKKKNVKQLKKYRQRLNPGFTLAEEKAQREEKQKKKQKRAIKKSEKELKDINLGRGVETMYRTTYRTHVNLSSIADNKANIMLSINAIIVSIVVSNLVPQLDEDTRLIFPTILLLAVCLAALVFAILSTRPKITEGKFTREDIKEKRSNLLFFGNFYNMELDDFHWGMMEMIKDSDFLYSSMTRDLYYLGVVLAKKYKFLRICYSIFMYGLIVAVIAFAIAFSLPQGG
jgi:predicted metal-dependent HD superfamily phosphohydrolase